MTSYVLCQASHTNTENNMNLKADAQNSCQDTMHERAFNQSFVKNFKFERQSSVCHCSFLYAVITGTCMNILAEHIAKKIFA